MTQRLRTAVRRHSLVGCVALVSALLPTAVSAQASAPRSGIDSVNLDRAVRPQDDFFRFVNGGWLRRTSIPGDAASWGSFNELREDSRTALHTILEEMRAQQAPGGSERQKVRDLYLSYMDSARVESLGLAPVQPDLKVIAGINSAAQLPAAFARLAKIGVRGPLGVAVGPDQKASTVNIVTMSQAGLGLPDREYYLARDAKMQGLRTAYQAYIAELLTLAKQPDAAAAAARVMALETAIAEKHWDRTRNRDRNATYNKMTVAELAALAPNYDFAAHFAAAGLGRASDVVVRQPDFLPAVATIIAATPVATWREYLTFKLLDTYADELPAAFQNARFQFRGRTLGGQQEMAVRWKRGVDEVGGALGEAVGKVYVERNFKPEAKARMDALVKNLREAYSIGIDSLEWMSPETKTQAKDKLAKFTVKIAYPDQWRDYSALTVKAGDLYGNAKRSNEFQYADVVSRLGEPVDRSRWNMTPQTVNAYYNASNNEIVFPAAILQPPFFDVSADDAVNYGAIGAVIGHEIGHGFDDQGRKSDGQGNLRDWWTPADAAAFEVRTKKLGAQYDAIVPIDAIHINGTLTMGENIGDLSGLAQAYRAYKLSLKGAEAPVIGGFTGDQRFFIGFAQIWRTKYQDAALRQQLLTDPHSPGTARGFVPLANNDAFISAFGVQPGDGMYRAPEDRVRIW